MALIELDANKSRRNDGAQAYLLAAGFILVMAAAVRFPHLSKSLHLDETWVVDLVQKADLRPHTYQAPPLFYYILRFWSHFAGFSNAALRTPAAVLGVLTVLSPYIARLLAPKTLSRPVTLVWSILLAFSSPLIFYSTMVKQYTLDTFVSCILISLALGAMERNSIKLWYTFFGVGILGVCTLHSSIFIVAAVGIVTAQWIGMTGTVKENSRRHAIAILVGFIVLSVAFLTAYLLYLAPGPETTRIHGDMKVWYGGKGFWLNLDLNQIYATTRHWMGQAFNLTPLFLPFLFLWVVSWLARGKNQGRWRFLVLILACVPPAEIAMASLLGFYPYGETRLMLLAFPSLYLLSAMALVELDSHGIMNSLQVAVSALMLGGFVFMGVALDSYNSSYMRSYDLRPIFDYVADNHKPGEPVVVENSLLSSLVREHPNLAKNLRVFEKSPKSLPGFYLVRSEKAEGLAGSPRFSFHGIVAVHVNPIEFNAPQKSP